MTEHELMVLQLIADDLDGHAAQFVENAIDCIRQQDKRIHTFIEKLKHDESLLSTLVSAMNDLDASWLAYNKNHDEVTESELTEQRKRMLELINLVGQKPSK